MTSISKMLFAPVRDMIPDTIVSTNDPEAISFATEAKTPLVVPANSSVLDPIFSNPASITPPKNFSMDFPSRIP